MIDAILKLIYQFFCGGSSSQQQPQQHQSPPQKPEVVYTPYHPPVHQPQPHRLPVSEHRPTEPYQDDDAINQNNETYKRLRAQANEEGDKMAQCFQQGHEAYARGDGAKAKQFSNEGKEHQRKMDSLNKQASDWIFKANNLDNQPGEIDLHGLYVKEAISRAEDALGDAKRNGETEVKFIVGKGLHSTSGAKIRPAIEDLMKKYQLDAEIDPRNAGVLVVRLHAGAQHSHMGTDEISRRIERGGEGCTIM